MIRILVCPDFVRIYHKLSRQKQQTRISCNFRQKVQDQSTRTFLVYESPFFFDGTCTCVFPQQKEQIIWLGFLDKEINVISQEFTYMIGSPLKPPTSYQYGMQQGISFMKACLLGTNRHTQPLGCGTLKYHPSYYHGSNIAILKLARCLSSVRKSLYI